MPHYLKISIILNAKVIEDILLSFPPIDTNLKQPIKERKVVNENLIDKRGFIYLNIFFENTFDIRIDKKGKKIHPSYYYRDPLTTDVWKKIVLHYVKNMHNTFRSP